MAGIPKEAEHHNGTATTTPSEITFSGQARTIMIQNTEVSAANELLVSFDGGSSFKALRRLAAFSIDLGVPSIWVKSSAGTVAYEAVVTT